MSRWLEWLATSSTGAATPWRCSRPSTRNGAQTKAWAGKSRVVCRTVRTARAGDRSAQEENVTGGETASPASTSRISSATVADAARSPSSTESPISPSAARRAPRGRASEGEIEGEIALRPIVVPAGARSASRRRMRLRQSPSALDARPTRRRVARRAWPRALPLDLEQVRARKFALLPHGEGGDALVRRKPAVDGAHRVGDLLARLGSAPGRDHDRVTSTAGRVSRSDHAQSRPPARGARPRRPRGTS